VVLVENEEFVKSDPDKREYRAIRLEPSQLEVLLVSDGDTDVEAAAVHVKAGHFCDPPNRAGLAHFHEHMLFLGTTKYPDEHDYENFLSKNGGSTNAYTDMQDTNYYFSVAPLDHDEDDDEDDNDGAEESTDEGGTSAALSGALDRFAQFFISPSFAVESVERELRAINSEHLNSITSDQWRNYQLLKNGCNPSHPFHKFGCGNYKTLTDGGDIAGESAETSGGSSPRDDLLQFWNDNYQSKSLKLCVVGRASLDDLQKTVEDTFGYVPPPTSAPVVENLSSAASPINEDKLEFPLENSRGMAAFGEEQLGRVREVVPIMDSRSIKLYFAFPPMNDPLLKETHPYRVISHLLGHESPGSLHYLLNDEGLINGLSSGTGVGVTDFSLATFSMSLTPEGMKKRDYVLSLVFQWISLVQSVIENDEHGLMEQYHDELRRIATMNFRFRENGDPTDFASGAAELMFEYEPSLILAGSAFTKEYRPELAKALMERMNPENVLITISDQDLDKENSPHADSETSLGASEWQTEQWYRAKYREEKISQAVMEKWKTQEIDPRLKLPDLNAFIPDDFSLKCEDPEEKTDPSMDYSKQPPCLLIDRPDSLRMWHKLDRTWKVPKTSIRMHLTSPNLYRSPRTMTMARLYQKVLNDDLNSFVYDASVAGCNYR
jgi:insulysin